MDITQLAKIIEIGEKRLSEKQLELYANINKDMEKDHGGPYPWQVKFHNVGQDHSERCLMAANQSGKTRVCSAEDAIHLTGMYPKWWHGKKFSGAIKMIVGAVTNQDSRDITQAALLGETDLGTGWIPKQCIDLQSVSYRQCGIGGVIDRVRVRHTSGAWSSLQFMTYEQGVAKWRGRQVHLVHLDEEPPEDIFAEAQTRILTLKGIVILSFTPHLGYDHVVDHFMTGGLGIYVQNATWKDAPHLDEDRMNQLANSYSESERDTRMKGLPMVGSGLVYSVDDKQISCDPFEIPDYWSRISAIDFGLDHPTAVVWMAHDRDSDILYLYDCYRSPGVPEIHAAAIRARPRWIKIAWPHDGLQRGKADGKALKDQYIKLGVNMMHISARYDDSSGGGQGAEAIVAQILSRMKTGRFKVFSHLGDWFEEKRIYHRKDGKIVPKRDDLISATHYGTMMIRHATSTTEMLAPRQMKADTNYNPLSLAM